MAITLKNTNDEDVVYSKRSVNGDSHLFAAQSNSLLARPTIQIAVKERQSTNRVSVKLSIPTLSTGATLDELPKVVYTEIGSIDLSAVKGASVEQATDFFDQFVSLVSGTAVRDAFINGLITA